MKKSFEIFIERILLNPTHPWVKYYLNLKSKTESGYHNPLLLDDTKSTIEIAKDIHEAGPDCFRNAMVKGSHYDALTIFLSFGIKQKLQSLTFEKLTITEIANSNLQTLDLLLSLSRYYLSKEQYQEIWQAALDNAIKQENINYLNEFDLLITDRIKLAKSSIDVIYPSLDETSNSTELYILSPYNNLFRSFKIVYSHVNKQYNAQMLESFANLSLYKQEKIVEKYRYKCLIFAIEKNDIELTDRLDQANKDFAKYLPDKKLNPKGIEMAALKFAAIKENFTILFCLLNNFVTLCPYYLPQAIDLVKTTIGGGNNRALNDLVANYSYYIDNHSDQFKQYIEATKNSSIQHHISQYI